MNGKALTLLGLLAALAGCQTTSFAAPDVDLSKRADSGQLTAQCTVTPSATVLTEDVQGGFYLIDNFVHVYRCAVRQATDGRQGFEVPALLLGAGAALAAAFGAGPDVAIAGGGTVAILNAGKNYYAPGESAEIYQRGLDAISCISVEAAGVPAFEALARSAANGPALLNGRSAPLGSVTIGAHQQYFRMIRGALLSTESVVAQRLSKRGTFDPAGLIAEINAIRDRVKKAETEADAAIDATANTELLDPIHGDTGTGASADQAVDVPQLNAPEAARAHVRAARSAEAVVQLDLQVMHPRLQECVMRAKL